MNRGRISKLLSCILLCAMLLSLMPATAAFAEGEGDSFKAVSGTLSSGYYVFGYLNGSTLLPASDDTSSSNWIRPGAEIDVTDGSFTTSDYSVVWYYDAAAGTLSTANDSSLFVCWPTSGNSAFISATATPLTITDTGDGVYNITVTDTPARFLRYNTTSGGWRFYSTNTGKAEFAFFKLVDGDTPAHEHVWGEWTSNGDGTHSHSCQAADCPIGTETAACSFTDSVITAPTCVDEGETEQVCTVCGYSRTVSVPATGVHTDADEDWICDVCGQEIPKPVVYNLGTELHEGDEVVIYSVSGNLALSTTASGNKLAGVEANVSLEEEQLVIVNDATAVMTVEYADALNFRLKAADGGYLTTGATGNSLSFGAADDYSLWYLETADAAGKTVYIRSTNAAYSGNKNQALEYYNGNFTTYGIKTTDAYQFRLYIHANENAHTHDWVGAVTTEPSCTAKGLRTFTCSGCGESYTEEIPMIAHVDADNDGFCDSCGGLLYHAAQTLNDRDRVIIVNPTAGKAMLSTASGTRMSAADVNAQAGVTAPVGDDSVWTVQLAEGGFYLLSADGKYLTSGETGGSLSLTEEASAYSLWALEIVDEETVYVRNVNAAYNGNANQALEYYNGSFTTYGIQETNTIFHFALYTLPGEEAPELARVYGYSITTGGQIGINVYLQLPEALTAQEGAHLTLNGEEIALADALTESAAGSFHVVKALVAAKDIFKPVSIQVIDGEGQAVTLYKSSDGSEIGTAYETSVADYLTWQAENSSDENLLRLVKTLYNYGSYAAFYWGTISELPALYTGAGLDVSEVTDLSAYERTKVIAEDPCGLGITGISLLLKTDTSIRIYFTAKDITNVKAYLADGSDFADGAAIAAAGAEVSFTHVSGKNYYVEIPKVSAADLDKSCSFTLRTLDGEGNEVYPVMMGNISALSYACSVLQAGSDENLTHVAQALALYNEAANVYFGR